MSASPETLAARRIAARILRCYQCDAIVGWLAPDGRCLRCTRCTPEDVQ